MPDERLTEQELADCEQLLTEHPFGPVSRGKWEARARRHLAGLLADRDRLARELVESQQRAGLNEDLAEVRQELLRQAEDKVGVLKCDVISLTSQFGECDYKRAQAETDCDRLSRELATARAVLRELVSAMRDYEMEVDEEPPYKHRGMMDRAEAALAEQDAGKEAGG